VCVATLALGAQSGLSPRERQLQIDSFEHVWKTVREAHWDPTLGGVDWQRVHDELRPRMDQVKTAREARAVLVEMLARLKQSHFNIIPFDVYEAIEEAPAPGAKRRSAGDGRTGMEVRVIGGQALVVSVEAGSEAARQGVQPGWQITRIDGEEIGPVIAKAAGAVKQSELTLMRALLARLTGPIGEQLRIQFRDGADQLVERDISLVRPRGTLARFGHMPPQYVWIEWRKVPRNTGYIRFNLFLDPARLVAAFEEALKSFKTVDGIVIDLRGNPGGIGIMAAGMAGFFIDQPDQRLGTMYMRQTSLKFVVYPRQPTYRGPLAILIDGASASTAEIFAGGLKDLGRARIFGARSAGAALPSLLERLPNGDGFQYAAANYISEGGKVLEGAGVTPDVEVTHTRERLLAGRDAALEAALDWIRARK